jgi:hypothetical protein
VLIWRANRAIAENFFGYSVANILGFSTNPDPAVVPLLKYIDDDSGFAVGRSCRLSTIRIPSQYRFLNGGIDFSANSKHCQERLDSGVIVSELV